MNDGIARTQCQRVRGNDVVTRELGLLLTRHIAATFALVGLVGCDDSAPETVMERRVRFARPGRYLLWAESSGCRSKLLSDTIVVTVVP